MSRFSPPWKRERTWQPALDGVCDSGGELKCAAGAADAVTSRRTLSVVLKSSRRQPLDLFRCRMNNPDWIQVFLPLPHWNQT